MSRYAFSQELPSTREGRDVREDRDRGERREFITARRTIEGNNYGGGASALKRNRDVYYSEDISPKRFRTSPPRFTNNRDVDYIRRPRTERDSIYIEPSPPNNANVTIGRGSNARTSSSLDRRSSDLRPRETHAFTIDDKENENEPIDKKFLLSCFQHQNKNFHSMIADHRVEVDKKIGKIHTEVQTNSQNLTTVDTTLKNLQKNLPDMIDDRITQKSKN